MSLYIDGRQPVQGTTGEFSIGVQTPYIQQSSGTPNLAVPNDGPDTFIIMTSTQTLANKTMLAPYIQGGSITSATLTQPVISTAVLTQPTIYTGILISPDVRMSGGQMSGGAAAYIVFNERTMKTAPVGASKSLDFSTADIFIVELTQPCTLTISNAGASKDYLVILTQGASDAFHAMSWMTGFVCERIASGPTQKTGAVDVWRIFYDGTRHLGIGAQNVGG